MFKVLSILLVALLSLNVQTTWADSSFNPVEINKALAEAAQRAITTYKESSGRDLRATATISLGDQTSGDVVHLKYTVENLRAPWSEKSWDHEVDSVFRVGKNVEMDVDMTFKTEPVAFLRWILSSSMQVATTGENPRWNQVIGQIQTVGDAQEVFERLFEMMQSVFSEAIADDNISQKERAEMKKILDVFNRLTVETTDVGFTITFKKNTGQPTGDCTSSEKILSLGFDRACLMGEIKISVQENSVTVSMKNIHGIYSDDSGSEVSHERIKADLSRTLTGPEARDEEVMNEIVHLFLEGFAAVDGNFFGR